MTEPTNTPDQSIRFTYTNWKGETSERHATPVSIRWGSTGWHPYDCWLMLAYDHDKEAEREFSLVDFAASRPQPAVTVKPLDEKRAPVQGFKAGIPWAMHLRAYDAYCKRYSEQQALIEGGCLGGFGTGELDLFIPGWREELDENNRLRAEITRLSAIQPEAPNARAYDLAYAIAGGEDAPGLLDSIPTADLVKMIRDERVQHQDWMDAAAKTARTEALREAVKYAERGLLHFCNLVQAGDAQGGGREFERQIHSRFYQLKAEFDTPAPAPQTVKEAARVLLSARPNIPENTMISKWLRALSEQGVE